jgi:putative addiction module killer protein
MRRSCRFGGLQESLDTHDRLLETDAMDTTENTLNKTGLFIRWLDNLTDRVIKSRIEARIVQAEEGNFGDTKSVGEGVFELRFKKIGIRLYYFQSAKTVYWLLIGGDKKTQAEDITKAKLLKRQVERENKC